VKPCHVLEVAFREEFFIVNPEISPTYRNQLYRKISIVAGSGTGAISADIDRIP